MKGDRFDVAFSKMILPLLGTKDLIGKNGKYLSAEVRTLLRKEHAAVVRMVRDVTRKSLSFYDDNEGDRAIAISLASRDILAALAKRDQAGAAMTDAQFALKLSEKLSDAISLLIIHGIITDGERDKARKRLDKWATENGLKRKGT